MTGNRWVGLGALTCALAIAAAAFGAHALAHQVAATAMARWETATRYLLISGAGQLAAGLWQTAASGSRRAAARGGQAAACLLAGGVVFSVSVALLALGAPSWLGAAAPFGGLLLIGGFVWLAVAAFAR
jgi:uncharacterized membrane protein YgdD (TMEM256/DUF423 family)